MICASTAGMLLLLAFGQGSPPSTNTIFSHILRADGTPAANASCYLIARSDAKGEFTWTKGLADSDGRTELTPPPDKGVTPMYFVVRCPGQALFFSSLWSKAVPAEIRLQKGASTRIAFVTPSGSPAQGEKVAPTVLRGPDVNSRPEFLPLTSDLRLEVATVTDSNGSCTMSDMPIGDTVQFDVLDDRFDHVKYTDAVKIAETQVGSKIVKLEPASSVSGRLTRSGEPVSGVEVLAQAVGTMGEGRDTTDAQGSFKLTRLGAGAYNVGLNLKEPTSNDWTGRAKEITLQPGENKVGLQMQMEKGALVVGRVVDEQGNPLKDVNIGIYGPARPRTSGWVQSARTDSSGHYRMRVPSGEQMVYVMSATTPEKNISVADLKQVAVDFKLPTPKKDVTILGRVQDAAEKPISNATVDVIFEGQEPTFDLMHNLVRVTTDSNGSFSFVLPSEARRAMILAHTESLGLQEDVIPSAGHLAVVTLKPHELATASGIVTDESGKPLEGVAVDVLLWSATRGMEFKSVKTGSDGRFSIPELYPNHKYSFTAKAEGYGDVGVDFLTPLPNEAVDLKQFRLLKADSYLTGVVKDQLGTPVVGAYVGVQGLSRGPVTTDTAGHFRVEAVTKGTHSIYVNKGNEFVNGELVAGKGGQVVILKPEYPTAEASADTPVEETKPNGKAHEFESKVWLNSKPLTIAALHGKIVLLDFWGVTCGPCIVALPKLEKIAKRFANRSIVVIGINDSADPTSRLTALAKKHGITYPLTIDRNAGPNQFGRTASKYHIGATPTLVLIDQNGNVVAQPESPERATEMIVHLLRKQ